MLRIAIMGTGMVGGALDRALKLQNIQAGLYDPPRGLSDVGVLRDADVIFVAVPTPYYLDGSGFDDSFLRAAIEAIPVPGKTIVLKSTITPGTTDRFQTLFPQHRILFNPEFLTETVADQDMQFPKRQIVGYTSASRRDAELVLGILPRAPFEKIVPAKEAELVKYFGNAFYALKVVYANQMYDVCEKLGLDYETIKSCAQAEPMVGPNHLEIFHKGYRGYGGKCLPKDTRSIIQLAESLGVDLSLLKAAETYNNALGAAQGIDIQWAEGSPKKASLYLVTGGAGFIGSNLVDELLKQGHRVRVLDNFSSGKRTNLNPKAELFEADFTSLEAIRPAFVGVDGVFHMGARPSVPFSVEDPIGSSEINIMGTVNVLTAARDAKVKRVVYSASSSAYGIQPILPQRVDMTPNPQSPYAIQKYVGELYARQFAELYGLETVSLRYFNVYGSRMNDVGAYVPVFTFFLRQARAGQPLTVFGDGEQSRDFTHVSDVVALNIAAMISKNVGKGEVLNGGAGGRTTINEIVKMFGRPAVYLDPRPGDVPRSQSDSSITMQLLDWKPQISFRDGLSAWMRSEGIEPAA